MAGNEQSFRIEIDEVKQTGVMAWPFETSRLTKVRVASRRDAIQCFVRWPTMTLRCIIKCYIGPAESTLTITLAGSSEKYTLSGAAAHLFKKYIQALHVPEESPVSVSTRDVVDFEFSDDSLALVNWSIFFAHRPNDPEIEFAQIWVNGLPADASAPREFPALQGKFVSLGFYHPAHRLMISWELSTAMTGSTSEVVVGYFPGSQLSRRVIWERLSIESFSRYAGAGSIPR